MYHILYVDDEPGLLEIGKIFLERSEQFSVETITSAPAALRLLSETDYDAIISDYQMPGMDGIGFLKRIRTSGNTIPFILFTGRGREEVAIQALNEGADFYLQKGGEPMSQFAELAHQINRAIQQRLAEASIRDLERREADIINFLPDATFAIDTNGKVIAWNRAIEEMVGVPAAEMLGKGDYEYAIPFYGQRQPVLIDQIFETDETIAKRYTHIIRKKDILIADTQFPHLKGKPVTLMGIASPLYDREGKIVGAIESIRDITEWRKAEDIIRESEDRYRNVVEDQTEFISRFSPEGTHVFVNDAYCRYFGLKRDEILGHRFRPKIPAGDKERLRLFFASLTPENPVDTIEHRIIMPDGSIRWQRWTDRAIFDPSGTVIEYQSVGQDITDYKLAEEALRNSRRMLAEAMDLANLVIWECDLGTGILTFDDRFSTLYGIDAKQKGITQMTAQAYLRDLVHPEDLGILADEDEKTRTTTDPHYVSKREYRIIRSDGAIRHIEMCVGVTKDAEGRTIKTHGVNQDITDRKLAKEELLKKNEELNASYGQIASSEEELRSNLDELTRRELALRESEERYRKIFENSPLGMALVSQDFRYISVNPAWVTMTGFSEEELLKLTVKDITHPDHLGRDLEHMKELAAGTIPVYGTEKQYIRKDGSILWGLLRVTAIRDRSGSLRYFAAQVEDITESKRAEEALRESERRFHELSDLLPLAVYEVDTQGNLMYANHISFEYFGYPKDDFKKGLNVMQMLAPWERERAAAAFRAIVEGTETTTGSPSEYMALRKDGSTFPISIYLSSIVVNGRITGFRGIIADNTERKMVEDALRKSKIQYDAMVSNIPVGIYILRGTPEGSFSFDYVSPKLAEIFNVNTNSVQADPTPGLKPVYPDDLNTILTLNREKCNRGQYQQPQPFEWEGRAVVGGTTKWIHIGASPVALENGDIVWNGIVTDITGRKQAEDALRQANKKLNLLYDITRHDLTNQLLALNGYLEISKNYAGDAPKISEFIQREEQIVKTIERHIAFTREYEAIGVKAPVWQDCRTLVGTASKQVPLGQVAIKNDLPPGAEVFADPLIVKVFYTLMDNAVRYAGKISTLRFSVEKRDDCHVVVCEDDGDGVVPEDKERIFESGFGKNTGMGLFLSREILSITGITIRETGGPDTGARFEITVPEGAYRSTGSR